MDHLRAARQILEARAGVNTHGAQIAIAHLMLHNAQQEKDTQPVVPALQPCDTFLPVPGDLVTCARCHWEERHHTVTRVAGPTFGEMHAFVQTELRNMLTVDRLMDAEDLIAEVTWKIVQGFVQRGLLPDDQTQREGSPADGPGWSRNAFGSPYPDGPPAICATCGGRFLTGDDGVMEGGILKHDRPACRR